MSNSKSFKFQYKSSTGDTKDGEISLSDLAHCAANGVRLSSLLHSKYPDYSREYGSVTTQAMNSNGVYLKENKEIGVKPSTVAQALGQAPVAYASASSGAPIVSVTPDGSSSAVRSALFGEVILDMVEDHLEGNFADVTEQAFRRMIASSYSIPSGVFVQPIINTHAAEDDEYESAPVENTLPPQMVSIGLSQQTRTVPAYTIGLEITDKARTQLSLDVVALIIAQHSKITRNRGVYRDINRLFVGNTAAGEAPIASVTAQSLDASITQPGVLTEKAWSKFLIDPNSAYNYDMAIMDTNSYLAIVNREGRPELPAGGYASNTLTVDGVPTIVNMLKVGVPDVLIVPTGTIPAGTILVLDTAKAIAEVSDSSVSYQAEERSQLLRNTGFRWDWSRLYFRLMGEEPFKALSLTI